MHLVRSGGSPKRRPRFPKAGPVKIINTETGEVRYEAAKDPYGNRRKKKRPQRAR